MLNIDGQRKMLKVGQSFAGVTLVAAGATTATLNIGGKHTVVGMSQLIGTNFEAPTEERVDIARNGVMQYRTTATINGRRTQVMVDTGANVVAMSATHAATLGIDFSAVAPAQVETASGKVPAYAVNLDSIDVGGIRVDNVRATVVQGDYPTVILLGMTYLRHVKMQEHNGILTLTRAPM